MNKTFKYFDTLHNQLLEESQIKISRQWFMHKKRKQSRKDLVLQKVISHKVKRRQTHVSDNLRRISIQRGGTVTQGKKSPVKR